ncbi:cell adhesion molecule Dscam1-like isoform X1 [Dermacentor andersoni]|uniref:cell adhesion molecule Dscam1-like isoform X1 n=1 Tax=Dermacentor andersoni TaxID=34620 RepID=UPI002416EAAF|nr:cell adhesion molecule Dscam2-like isoform X1 [Dermacentor andersoni]
MRSRLPLRSQQSAGQTRRAVTSPGGCQRLQAERRRSGYAGLFLLFGLILGSGDTGCSMESGGMHSHRAHQRLLSPSAAPEKRDEPLRRARAEPSNGEQTGPAFVQEPPSRVVYLNTTGAWIHCQAYGHPPPTVRWRHVAFDHLASVSGGTNGAGSSLLLQLHAGALGEPLEEVSGVRRLLPNGTLVMAPFGAAQARHHAGVVQCVAQNDVGSIVSRDVHLRGVVAQEYKTKVYDEFVVRGNTAVLHCQMPTFVREDIEVTGWLREDGLFIQPGGAEKSASKKAEAKAAGGLPHRYKVLSPSGELLVRNVSSADDGVSYRCQTRHKLTGSVKVSDTAGRVIVNPSTGPFQPRHIFTRSAVSVDEGSAAELVCVAHGYSVPEYRWYKLSGGTNDSREPLHSSGRIAVHSDTLLIRHASISDSGRYLCVANNSLASEPFTVTLSVLAPLSVVVHPDRQTVDFGGTAAFNCIPSGNPVSTMVWIKDGKALRPGDTGVQVSPDGRSLVIQPVSRKDAGIYQCLVRNERDSAQGAARLKLGFSAPTFLSVFAEQSAEPGRGVSLQCSATGSPLPRISWALDGAPLPDVRGRTVPPSVMALPGHVSSFVNISAVRSDDGGLYTCRASNGAGTVEHAARLNVVGPPRVRPMAPVSAVAGEKLALDCRYSGYPIEVVSWSRGGIHLPSSKRQEVLRDGSLVISEVRQYEDNGTYTCHVTGTQGESANGTVEVNVRVRPTIAPFSFPSGLQAGMRARLGCTVISGDPPFEFGWRKDGRPLGAELGVRAQTDAFSSDLTFTSLNVRHNGNYTCVVSNAAASASHSASLVVQVPPQWVIEPSDTSVLLGRSVRMDCWADGHPLPTITWERENLYGTPGFSAITVGTEYEIYANGSLLVKNAQEQSAGRYLCQATNGIRSGLSKLVHLKVHAGPHFASKFRSEAVRRGDTARLRCKVQGDAPIALSWAKDGQPIGPPSTDPRYTFREETPGSPKHAASLLVITKVERRDAALFTCHASNAYGADNLNIKLIVQEPPEPPTDLKATEVKSRSFKLSWTPSVGTNNAASTYHVQCTPETGAAVNASVEGTATLVSVRPLRPAFTYRCQVRAQNDIGIGDPSKDLEVTAGIEVPGGPPLEVKAIAVDSQSIRVTWKPPERELWHGELKGYYVGYRLDQPGDPYLYKTLQLDQPQVGSTEAVPTEVLLSPLRKFSPYLVLVQAFNAAGPGPRSDEVAVSTLDDVPSQAPQEVQCSPLSSDSIRVTWQPPHKSAIHGYLQGYRIWYAQLPASRERGREEKAVTGQETTLVDLRKYTNYFIQVAAFTQRGLGAESEPVFCRTLEDVPDAPEDLKVLIVSATSLLVAWKPPVHRNGLITMYSIYAKTLDKQNATVKLVPTSKLEYNLTLVPRNTRVEVWVTASSRVGEGPPSKIVAQTTSDQVPARIVDFDEIVQVAPAEDVHLSCRFLGTAPVHWEWKHGEVPVSRSNRTELTSDGSLSLRRVDAASAGNYTCHVRNRLANDRRIVALIVRAHLEGFVLKVVSQTATSLQLTASGSAVDDQVVQVLEIHLKSESGEWQQRSLVGRHNDTYHLDGLQCGTRYQLYAVAFLASGRREQSDLLATRTLGSPPVAPNKEDIVRALNGSHVQVMPSAWRSGGCPLTRLSIEHRLLHGQQPEWIARWNHTSPAAGVLPQDLPDVLLGGLQPETWYVVRLMAANAAGLTKVKYDVMTPSALAGVADKGSDKSAVAAFLEDTTTLVSMASSGVVLLAGLIAVICLVLYKRRRNGRAASTAAASARSGAKNKRKPVTSSSRPRTSSSQQQQSQPKPAESRSSDLATATTTTTISTSGGNERAAEGRPERTSAASGGIGDAHRRGSGGGGSSSVPPVLPQKKNKEAARRSREQLSSAARSSPVRKSQSTATSKTSSNAGSQQLLSQQQQQQHKQHQQHQQKNKQLNKQAKQQQEQTPRIQMSPTKKQFFDEEITPYATFQLSPTKGDHGINIDDDGEEFKTFTIHHGEPPYLTKGSLDAPSTCSKNGKEEFYSHSHAANSHSLTSGSSNQDELLRAYEYARRHPPGSSSQASAGGALMHYDAPDDSHTTGSEGSTDPGIRQFTESPPEPNERRQAACITPGSGGGMSKDSSTSSSSSSSSSSSAGGLGPDGGADDATPVNTPSQASAIPACFAVWDRAPLPGRSGLVARAGHLPQVKVPSQAKVQPSKSQQPLPPPPLPTKKGSVLSTSTPAPTVVPSAPPARFVKKGWPDSRSTRPQARAIRLSSDESDESEGTASTFGHADVVRGSSSNEFSETDRSSQGAFGRRRKSGSDIIDC